MMKIRVPLYPGQQRAWFARGRELLLQAEERSGASHLLRAMALLRAAREPCTVVLAAPDDQTLREQHMDGPGGFWQIFEELPAGAMRWLPGGTARLENGSTIHLTTWEVAARKTADVLLVDDGDNLGLAGFMKLREKAFQTPPRDNLPRLVLVSRRPDEGWVREHWASLNGDGRRVELLASEIPGHLRGADRQPAQRKSFGDFIDLVLPTFEWYPHVELMVETAQKVVDGEITRLLISAPPRYWKSLVWARLLPAYHLAIRPHEWVAVVSAAATLAEIMSGDARSFYRAAGLSFRADSQDKALWRTPKGGGMWARGVGGWALGVGFDLGIIDDPFSSWEEAQKIGTQEAVETYFWKTFMGRKELRPQGTRPAAVVVNHQALAEGDLRGRILRRELEAKLPSEGWHILNLPALKRARRVEFPKSVNVIPDLAAWDGGEERRERRLGEPLCPQLLDQDEEGLLRLEKSDGRLFAATHQQDPYPDQGGGIFEDWWWSFACPAEDVEAMAGLDLTALILALQAAGRLPVFHREARAWDIAASLKGEGDGSASVRGGLVLDRFAQKIVFTDAREQHCPGHVLPDLIFETAQADGPGVDVILPQEPAAAGKILIGNVSGTSPGLLQVRLEAAGFRVVVVPTTGSKRVRANPHAGAAMPPRNAQGVEDGRMGRCFILPGTWNRLFCSRHQAFDGVTKPLDLVDAASYLFSELDAGSFLTGGIA